MSAGACDTRRTRDPTLVCALLARSVGSELDRAEKKCMGFCAPVVGYSRANRSDWQLLSELAERWNAWRAPTKRGPRSLRFRIGPYARSEAI